MAFDWNAHNHSETTPCVKVCPAFTMADPTVLQLAAFEVWLADEWPKGAVPGTEYDIDDLQAAFVSGWGAAVVAGRGAADGGDQT